MSPIYFMQFLIFSLCAHLFTLFTYMLYYSDLFSTTSHHAFELEYDYIIVGCGTAGSVIAHRLATETNYSFIVLEAGGRSHALLDIPALGPFMHRSVYDWQFETVPQEEACLAMNDRKCKQPQGKIIGGSSKLNNMVYVRGNISHYVDWFQGKHSQEYLREQFEFIEKYILHLSDIQYQSDLSDAILEGAKELGYNNLELEFDLGFSKSKVNQRNGKRWSTSDNLDFSTNIVTKAMVEKIIFHGNTARGVSFQLSDKEYVIFSRKGVILSAGAFNTPKILQLSGIGPANLLKSLGIPVIKSLPVGRNLQDHVTTGLDLILFNKSVSINAMDMINPYNAFQYFLNGKGPLTSPGCEVIGFLSTKNQSTANLQFMVLPVGLSTDRGSLFKNGLGINAMSWNHYFSKTIDKYVATILPIVLHPKSKGEVFINSTNPKLPPLINPKYLSNKEDKETLIKGLKLVMKFISTKSMKNIGAYLNEIKFPGCEHYEIFSDVYFECYITHLTLTSFHPVGTCSMGLPDSKNSVVDNSFRILGVNRLYVADASVLPTLPSGNINAAIAMMASVFFDTNIYINNKKQIIDIPFCYQLDWFIEYVFGICLI